MFTRLRELVRQVIDKVFKKETIKSALHLDVAVSDEMARAIEMWSTLYEDKPPWLSSTVKSLNLPSAIASEIARLVTIEFESEITNNEFLNQEYQVVVDNLRRYMEYACAKGGIVFKPYVNGQNIEVDFVQADSFFPTAYNSRGEITGAIFVETKLNGKKLYTRLEYHNLDGEGYHISNTAYVNDNYTSALRYNSMLGNPISLIEVPEWAGLEAQTTIKNVTRPLYAYCKIPIANTIESSSPLGVSIYARAIDLIKEADKQYSRILWEFEGSELAVHVSTDCFKSVKGSKGKELELPQGKERLYRKLEFDSAQGDRKPFIEYSPEIRDSNLFNGLNNILRRIEFNSGLAYGTLSDVQDADKTATEIKSSKQRSYSTVKDIQKSGQNALENLAYAMWVWGSLAGLPVSELNTDEDMTFNWDDSIIIDKDTNLASMQADVASGLVRGELYLMKKYGVTEEEALKMMPDTSDLIGEDPFANNIDENTQLPKDKMTINKDEVISDAENVSGKTLNGAQTQSLVSIISQYTAGDLTLGQAINVIAIAIGITKEEAKKIIDGTS